MSSANNVTCPVPVLHAQQLVVGYRSRGFQRVVLEGVNLSVARGELVCLLGPNGVGKSTLLRTLGRMQPPLAGAVALGGRPLESLSGAELARCLGVVLTDRVDVDSMRARQIVELGRYPHSGWLGGLVASDHDVVSWALTAVGATHLAERDFSRLSDGERQRLMVARALAQRPSLLMLDEPTAFLDVPSRVELMGLLRRLTRDEALAVVVSTHDIELALRSADVLWLIQPDATVVIGAPEDVIVSGAMARAFESPQIRFAPQERSFHWLAGERGTATVLGDGLPAAMAAAVLEREGVVVVKDPWAAPIQVHVDDRLWALSANGVSVSGDTYRALATHIRALHSRNSREGQP